MVKVNNPSLATTKGKIILQYRGTNMVFRKNPSSSTIGEVDLKLKVQTFGNSKEDFPLIFKLFDGVEIMLAFCSRSVYWKRDLNDNKSWVYDTESNIIENEILIDDENIFITGTFTFLKNISLSESRLDEYHYTAIFYRSKPLVKELLQLKSNELMANDLKYIQYISE